MKKFVLLSEIYDLPYCPIDDTTCCYYNFDNGRCMMDVMEDFPPYDECEAFDNE